MSASLYLIASVISSAIRMLINPLLAINLSFNDYALLGYFSSFGILFLPMLNFSIISYYLRNYYIIPDEKKEKVTNTIVISLLGIGSISSIFILTVFYIYFNIANVNFPFWPYAFLTVIQIVLNNFLILLQASYRIKREAKKYAKLTILSTLLWVVFVIILVVLFKFGAIGSIGANAGVAIVVGIYCFKKMHTKNKFDYLILRDALKFSWPLAISAILWYFLAGIDRAFLEKLNNTKQFALYNIGVSLSGFLTMFYTAIAQTFEPDIYKSIAEKNNKKLLKIISGIQIINAIPILIFILLATQLTQLLTAGRYTDAATFARILSLKNITTSIYYSIISIIIGYGHTKAELILRIFGAGVCIIMFKILIEKYGFYGAAWGQVISFLFMSIIGMIYIQLNLKFKKSNDRSN